MIDMCTTPQFWTWTKRYYSKSDSVSMEC